MAKTGLYEGSYSHAEPSGQRHYDDLPHKPAHAAPGASWSGGARSVARRVAGTGAGDFYVSPATADDPRAGLGAATDSGRARRILRRTALLVVVPVLVGAGFGVITLTNVLHQAPSTPQASNVVDASGNLTLQVRIPRAATAGDPYDLLVPSGFRAVAPEAGGGDVVLVGASRGATMLISSHPSATAPPLAVTGSPVSLPIDGTTAHGAKTTVGSNVRESLRFSRNGVWYVAEATVRAKTAQADLTLLDRVLRQWRFVPATDAGVS